MREDSACPGEEQPCQVADVAIGGHREHREKGNEMRGGSAGSCRALELSVGSYKMVHIKCLT